ncbi:MAG: membrane protein insertase YidC [Firmicutes bacterium]|jgi:YidC/Oxa1 family membrane protein insertase|nr:membrane protein insertase YidC [Bacillota bacterium]
MDAVFSFIGTILGYGMWACYSVLKDYGMAIVVFTLFTKVILLPIALWVQKNSIKMVRMKPQLDALRYQHIDDKDAYMDAQAALYKKEKYSPMAGVYPLLLQIPLIFGLIDVIYKPLKHLLHIPANIIDAFVEKTAEILGTTELGSSPQLKVVELLGDNSNVDQFMQLQQELGDVDVAGVIDQIQNVSMDFFGINLAAIPSFALDILLLVPIFAGLSALLMCYIQNKINVLQIEQNALSQWGMTIFMIAFSTYFAFLVPAGVGIYWIFGNLFSILSMYAVNWIYNPKKYIDYNTLEIMKASLKEENEANKKNKKRAKADYKRFFQVKEMKLMFFSEQSGFYKYYKKIIESILANSDLDIHYVTCDPNDAVFEMNNPRIIPYYVDNTKLIPLMMKVEADVVVMTSPDLEKYHVKRSKVRRDVEYIFTEHGCTSLTMGYRTGALDYFNTIFAISPIQAREVRAMEEQRGTQRKRVIRVGYGLIDDMIESYQKLDKKENEKPTILIAPSYQEDNILDSCLEPMLDSLLDKDCKVVVRPHPQYIRRFPVKMKEIIDKYKERMGENFSIETDFSSNVTVYTADVVITDWSAIGCEFSFTTNKPTLYVNTKMKVVNAEWEEYGITPADILVRDVIGISISKEDTVNTYDIVKELMENQDDYKEQISELKEKYFYNLGHSGEVGADYIIRRIKSRHPEDSDNENKEGQKISAKKQRHMTDDQLKRRFGIAAITSFLLAFTLCVFGPLELYLTNHEDLWFGLDAIIPIIAVIFSIGFILSTLVGALPKGKLHIYIICLIFGVALALYVQGNFLNIDYGVESLNGTEIKWEDFTKYGVLDSLAWCVCIAAPFVIYHFAQIHFRKIITALAGLLVAVQLIALIVVFAQSGNIEKNNYSMTKDGMYTISHKDNTIVFVLDTFDEKYYDDLLEKHPEYKDMLDGFVQYNNTTATGARTILAMPSILTGEPYKKDITYTDYLDKIWDEDTPYDIMARAGYDTRVFAETNFFGEGAQRSLKNCKSSRQSVGSNEILTKKLYKLTLYKYSPHYLKERFWMDTAEFDLARNKDDYSSANDARFYKGYVENGGYTYSQEYDKAFRLYLLNGAHDPIRLRSDATLSSKTTSRMEQMEGVFKILFEILEDMKANGVYEDANIIITADHGNIGNLEHIMFLYKAKGANGKYSVSSAPVSNFDIPSTLAHWAGGDPSKYGSGRIFYDISENDPRIREFYLWTGTNKEERIEEWEISGNAYDKDKQKLKQKYFTNGGRIEEYKLGTVLTFEADTTANQYCVDGFRKSTGFRTPVVGRYAKMEIPFEEVPSRGNLKVNFGLFHSSQKTSVLIKANGKEVFNRKLTDSDIKQGLKFEIPVDLIGADLKLTLDFEFTEVDMKQQELPLDSRKIMISMTDFLIEEE